MEDTQHVESHTGSLDFSLNLPGKTTGVLPRFSGHLGLYSVLGRSTEKAPGSWGNGSARGGVVVAEGGLFLGRSYGSLYSSPGKPRLWTEPFSEDGREEKSITVNSTLRNELGTGSSLSFFLLYLLPISSTLAAFLHDPESSAPLIDQQSPLAPRVVEPSGARSEHRL